MKTYLIQQKIKPLVNQYAVYEAAADSLEPGAMIGFAQQKRLALKEKFTVYTGEDKQAVAFEFQARSIMDFGARYDITDADGNIIGTVGKNFKSSLLRSTWQVFRPGQEDTPALVVQERSLPLAIGRRVWGLLPYIGDIPFFLKYNFDFTDPSNQQVVATYNKTTTFRDHYVLILQDNCPADIDPRVFIALGIMMDALQSR